MKLWKSIWDASQPELRIVWQESAKDPQEVGKQVLELAKAFKEYKSPLELFPTIGSISSLLDILNLPLVQVKEVAIPFVAIFVHILNLIVQKTRKEPTLEMSVALASQTAYLESLRKFLKASPKNEKKIQAIFASPAIAEQIKNLGEKLELDGEEFELDLSEAQKTLTCFSESKLAKVFDRILIARLQESGIEGEKAKIIAGRVSRGTYRYLKQGFIQAKNLIPSLVNAYGGGWERDLEAEIGINDYLENVIKKKAEEQLFDENFRLQDIYVSLEVKPVKKDGVVNHPAKAQNIQHWVQIQLQNEHKQEQILFIQGKPGMGKSTFCRMFADWVRRELHPIWTPILVCLRDIKTIERDFEQTLAKAVGRNFVSNDSNWLTDPNVRFLFILDGLDELMVERGFSHDLNVFLDQVISFQKSAHEHSNRSHRVLIAGRPLETNSIDRLISANLKRVEILPMSESVSDRWFARWQVLADTDPKIAQSKAYKFKEFLQDPRCLEEMRALAEEPLMLYLLAVLHRDGYFGIETSKERGIEKVKLWVYEKAIDRALNKYKLESDRNSNQKRTIDAQDLRNILAEAALCVMQSGREHALVSMLERRLQEKEDEKANALIAEARKLDRDEPLKNAIATFPLKSLNDANNSVEFFHKSFAEFFFAEQIVRSFEEWTSSAIWKSKNYAVSSKQLEWEIYDTFGYGNLTPEVVEYIIAFLAKSQLDLRVLLKRLNDFYLDWSQGKFIEATEEMLPLKKVRHLQQHSIKRGQREIDIYTGLNVLTLLLELNRYSQYRENLKDKISFHPCGQRATKNFDPTRLLCIINYSKTIVPFGFNQKLGRYFKAAELSYADLRHADLSGINFSGAYLSGANLRMADLRDINFQGADLSGADLSDTILRGADLSRSNLKGADLSYADLSGAKLNEALLVGVNLVAADLSGANLRNALLNNSDLSGTDLSGADFRGTHLKDLKWDSETNWTSAIGLKTVVNKPESIESK